MKQRALKFLHALPLSVCAASVVMWFLSSGPFGRRACAVFQGPYHSYVVLVADGWVTLRHAKVSPDPARPATLKWHLFTVDSGFLMPGEVPTGWAASGLVSTLQDVPYRDGTEELLPPGASTQGYFPAACRSVAVPFWAVSALTAIPVIWQVRRKARERIGRLRMRRGRCPSCDYDLRATPGRCPECGEVRAVVPN